MAGLQPAPADQMAELGRRFDQAVDRLLAMVALVDVDLDELNVMLWQVMRGVAADFADELVVRRHQTPPPRAAVVQSVMERVAAAMDRRDAMLNSGGRA
ncbi:MAG TPA: hypothetical protein VIQ53_26700 [Inquilinus sp.]